jgi:Leucine-rich repeat (LRR) protein
MNTCGENTTDLCSYLKQPACGLEILPLYDCNQATIQCLEPYLNKSEVLSSITDFEQVQPKADIYVVTIKGKNYPVLKSNSLVNNKIIYLDLTQNMIEKVESAAFDSIRGLKVVKLNKNGLVNVSFGVVKKQIEILYLSYNKIRVITRDMFKSLVELIFLELDWNNIESIAADAFDGNQKIKKLSLKSNKLKSIDFRSASILFLSLERNQFEEVKTENCLEGFDSLKLLNLDMNNISNIESNSFNGIARSIYAISLMHNHLKEISGYVFSNATFTSLKILALHANEIEHLDAEVYKTLGGLNQLWLSFNKMKVLDENMFFYMKSLEILTLNNQMIKNLSNGNAIFSGLTKLRIVLLSNNSIENLPDYVFNELISLEELDLHANLINKLAEHTFAGLARLKRLNLSVNNIEELSKCTFQSLVSVEDLYIEDNYVYKIEADAFNGISKSLKNLNLTKNYLQFVKNFHFSALAELKSLNLASNQISSIQQGSFSNLRKLECLKLDMNSIFQLDPGLFKYLVRLKKLDLSFNVINNLDMKMFKYMSQLEELDLNGNIITVLRPGLFSKLSSLKILNLANNLINDIDLSCFENLDQLEELQLSKVKKKITIMSSRMPIFPKLKKLNVEGAPNKLLGEFNLSKLDELNLNFGEINPLTLKSISTDKIKSLHLQNVIIENGSVDNFLNAFGSNLLETDLSGCVMKEEFNIKLLKNSVSLRQLKLSNCTGCFNTSSLANFANFTNLTSLVLSFNNITGELNNFLANLEKLEYLDLSHNRITYLKTNCLWSQTRLTYLDLSDNLIVTVDACVFERLEFINHFDLSLNFLTSLGHDAFCDNSLEQLSNLNLQSNSELKDINFRVFSSVLRFISIRNASLNGSMVDFLANSPYIFYLNLKDNRFAEIKTSHFEFTYLIFVLRLNRNLIDTIEDYSFKNMRNLLDLNLDFNNISVLNKRTLYGLYILQNLNLSHNRIEVINSEAFYKLRRLKTLDLSFNFIKSIANYTFKMSKFLKTLRLEINPLEHNFLNEQGLDGLNKIKFIFMGGHRFNFTYDVCLSIKMNINASIIKTVLEIDMYDALNIYVYGHLNITENKGGYLREAGNTYELCVCIVYLLRNMIQLNMLFDKDVAVYLSECSEIIRMVYDISIDSASLVT